MGWGELVQKAKTRQRYAYGDRGALAREQEETQRRYAEQGDRASDAYLDYAEDFDAGEALNRYATSAWSGVSERLGRELDSLAGRSVGAGRLDTGFFDADQGDVVRGVVGDFTRDLSARAFDATAMTLGARERLGAWGANRRDAATDLLMSRREEVENAHREERERRRRKRRGLAGAIGTIGGGLIGSVLPGVGTGIGAKIGGAIGGAF